MVKLPILSMWIQVSPRVLYREHIYIIHHDIPSTVESTVRLFADDSLRYNTCSSEQDIIQLQNDSSKLQLR